MHLCDIKFVSAVLQARKEQGKGWPGTRFGGDCFFCEILSWNSLAELVVPCMCVYVYATASSAGE
jgi:hypothetical protein